MKNVLAKALAAAMIAVLAPPLHAQTEGTGPQVSESATTPTASVDPAPAAPGRDPRWAEPVAGKPGLPNFFKVSDNLYRGAQPDDAGFAELKKLGIKTVVNLRAFHSDRSECAEAGLKYVAIPLYTWDVDPPEIRKFLETVRDEKNWPVFVHCMHGADRTGTMCAISRIVDEGWTTDEAIEEMTQGDFGYHEMWTNLVRTLRRVDPKNYPKPEPKPAPATPKP